MQNPDYIQEFRIFSDIFPLANLAKSLLPRESKLAKSKLNHMRKGTSENFTNYIKKFSDVTPVIKLIIYEIELI